LYYRQIIIKFIKGIIKMSKIIDNILAYRILKMLVRPFNETEAFKLGIIDDKGQNLIKSKDFVNTDQKDAYTYLHRLTFNLKKLINKLPGGENHLKNLIAALYLIKEHYNNNKKYITESEFLHILEIQDSIGSLIEEEIIVTKFLEEEMNVTGVNVATDEPVIKKKKKIIKRKDKELISFKEFIEAH